MRVTRCFLVVCCVVLLAAPSCTHATGDQTAFCRYSAAMALQQVDLDRVARTDVNTAKQKLMSYNRTIQNVVKVAPTPVADDVKPLADQWAQYAGDVQRARTIDDLHRADEVMAARAARHRQASDAVRRFVDDHCTADGLTR